MSIHFMETTYGFEYGAAKIARIFSDEKKGWVTISVSTPRKELQIYVTKTGKIRVHEQDGTEWIATPDKGESE